MAFLSTCNAERVVLDGNLVKLNRRKNTSMIVRSLPARRKKTTSLIVELLLSRSNS